LMEWSRETGVHQKTIAGRLEYGWPVGEALTQKPSQKKRKWAER
jgi:hypothetical protein